MMVRITVILNNVLFKLGGFVNPKPNSSLTIISNNCRVKNQSSLFLMLTLFTVQPLTLVSVVLGLLTLALSTVLFYVYRSKSTLIERCRKQEENNEHFLDQINDLKDSLLNKEVEYNHLFKLNSIYLKDIQALKIEVKDAQMMAEEADILKSNFLSNMSHEIRTPMNGILGFAQLLQRNDIDRDMQFRYLDIISHNGTMLVNLIDDIIDISKIEAGQLPLNKTDINLDDLMFDLYTFFNEIKFKQEKEHISLRLLNLNDDENNLFHTDSHRLQQVLTNLISNSIKFTDKGVVEFGYINKKEEKLIQFYVRDSGIGIPADKQKIIFDKFRQIEEGSTRKYGGTGIGLFISKHIVGMLGGNIWVESEEGKGSTFNFTMPYAEIQQKDNIAKVFTPVKRNYNWVNKQIVIAEDVETNFRFLNAVLSQTKATIVWKKDGEEVVNFCRQNPDIDLILMDIQMPKIDGYEATGLIKKINPQITIIAQTAYAMPNDNLKCIEAGCNDYISKPINSGLLLEKLDSYLREGAKIR
ncbi:MAG TPA: hybrid sensor histidine kinase/response regulator [Bacteroidales bacterium]|nr:hybrid sensor histidine kinase/response regulator [Bacteroidales bacterium]